MTAAPTAGPTTAAPKTGRRRHRLRALGVPLLLAAIGTAAAPGVVTVRQGDSLWEIARRNDTTVATLRQLNGLPGNATLIQPGQQLRVSAAAPSSSRAAGSSTSSSASAATHRANLAARPQPSKAQVRDLIVRQARKQGLDPALALAVAYNESGFQMRVVSSSEAIGAMQVLPSTGRWLSEDVVGRQLDLYRAEDNVVAGVTLLASLVRRVGVERGLAGYYQGLGSVAERGVLPETQRYIDVVLALRARFR